MNIKRRGTRLYLYRSRWVARCSEHAHGYGLQEYIGSLSSDAQTVPVQLKAQLTDAEQERLERDVCSPARRRAADELQRAAHREQDPLWRIQEAARLLAEAASLSADRRVPQCQLDAVAHRLSQIAIQEASVTRVPTPVRTEPMLVALNAVKAATEAVESGAMGRAPAEGVRATRTYQLWAKLFEAVSGDDISLLRALQEKGFVKAKRGS